MYNRIKNNQEKTVGDMPHRASNQQICNYASSSTKSNSISRESTLIERIQAPENNQHSKRLQSYNICISEMQKCKSFL